MDLQYFGANCFAFYNSDTRLVFDDHLDKFGLKSISKKEDISFLTDYVEDNNLTKLTFSNAGEFEIENVSVKAIQHKMFNSAEELTIYKLTVNGTDILFTGNCDANFSQKVLEEIGMIDILIAPCGDDNHLIGTETVSKLIKNLEPKLYIPSFYLIDNIKTDFELLDIDQITTKLNLEVNKKINKLKLKNFEISENLKTELLILEV